MEEEHKDAATSTTVAEELRLQGNEPWGCTRVRSSTISELKAERATTLDPSWAKDWWRRGVASELLKPFLDAVKFFSIAVELDPSENGYKEALDGVRKRIKLQKAPNGKYVLENTGVEAGAFDLLAVQAWLQVKEFIGENTFTMVPRYFRTQSKDPTSQQWLFKGFAQGISGMKGGIASLTLSVSQQAHLEFKFLEQQQWDSQEAFLDTADDSLGGFTQRQDLVHLASGFSHFGGSFLVLQNGGVSATGARPMLCPQSAFLSGFVAYQILAVLYIMELSSKHQVLPGSLVHVHYIV